MNYLIHYPRDFANEYTIYVGDKATIEAVDKILDGRSERSSQVRRITRKEAIRLGISRVKEAKRYGEQWFGGFAETGERISDTTAEIIEDAALATSLLVEQVEAGREYAY